MIDFSTIKELSIGGVNLRELSVNGVKMWQAGRLPVGYTDLAYIEAIGTQYIDTGITGQDGLSVEFTFVPIEFLSADNSTIIGCTTTDKKRMYVRLTRHLLHTSIGSLVQVIILLPRGKTIQLILNIMSRLVGLRLKAHSL